MSKKKVEGLRGVLFCCHGSSCTRAGARTVEKALRLHAREAGLKDQLRFVRTACTGLCKSAPIVIASVNPPPEEAGAPASTCGAHWHLETRPADAPALIDSHFAAASSAEPGPQPARKKKPKPGKASKPGKSK